MVRGMGSAVSKVSGRKPKLCPEIQISTTERARASARHAQDRTGTENPFADPTLSPMILGWAAGSLPPPFRDGRPVGSALYFMVTPTAPVRLHRIRNDQLYHYYLGDPLEVFLLRNDGTSERGIGGPAL